MLSGLLKCSFWNLQPTDLASSKSEVDSYSPQLADSLSTEL